MKAYDLDKLSELALLLNFILAKAFLAEGLESKLRTSLSVFSDSLYIRERKTETILQKMEDAFSQIHNHQFVMYRYEVMIAPKPENLMIDISIINHDEVKINSIKAMLKENAHILGSLGYEATLTIL